MDLYLFLFSYFKGQGVFCCNLRLVVVFVIPRFDWYLIMGSKEIVQGSRCESGLIWKAVDD